MNRRLTKCGFQTRLHVNGHVTKDHLPFNDFFFWLRCRFLCVFFCQMFHCISALQCLKTSNRSVGYMRAVVPATQVHCKTNKRTNQLSPQAHLHLVGMFRFMSDINQPSLTTPFYSVLVLFLFLWPFQLCFIPEILPQTLRFLTLFFRSYVCLIGPFNYISFYESIIQSWYNPLWLTGFKIPIN